MKVDYHLRHEVEIRFLTQLYFIFEKRTVTSV